jgi:hypothetical protein
MRLPFARKTLYQAIVLIGLGAVSSAFAQNTSGIFLTPIAGAPFSGVIEVERTIVPTNGGPPMKLRTVREVARDAQGRVYNVFRQLVPVVTATEPPIIRIHMYDPQTRSFTYLYPQSKTYMTGTVNHPAATEPADSAASPAGNSIPLSQFTKQEDLGTQTIDGVAAHGVRERQTIPATNSNSGHELLLTDEYWYSDDLHMNVRIDHRDPRTGSVTMTLTNVKRADPDPSLFQVPDGYKSMERGIGAGPASF